MLAVVEVVVGEDEEIVVTIIPGRDQDLILGVEEVVVVDVKDLDLEVVVVTEATALILLEAKNQKPETIRRVIF